MIAILILGAIIAFLIFIGYRIGGHSVRNENTTLYNQVSLLTQFNKHWANEAKDKYQLSSEIAKQQTANTSAQIQTVIQLLQTLQKEQGQNLSTNEHEKISQLIQQARQVIQN